MYYNQYPYNIFNPALLQHIEQQNYHQGQQQQTLKMRKAIKDYIETTRQVAPEYQQAQRLINAWKKSFCKP